MQQCGANGVAPSEALDQKGRPPGVAPPETAPNQAPHPIVLAKRHMEAT